jgi:autotransporter-associated beta strand protein
VIIDGAVTVDLQGLGSGFLPSGVKIVLTNGATLYNSVTVIRMNGNSTVSVATNCNVSDYWSMYQGSMSFQNGAKWTSGDLELNGTNVFSFNLGPAGFTKLTPSTLRWDGNKKFTQQIWTVDMADYTGGPTNITLVDCSGAADANMTASNFWYTATRTVTNPGIYTNSTIIYDAVLSAFILKVSQVPVNPPVADFVWDGGGGDSLWTNSLNWDPDVLPIANYSVLIDGAVTVDMKGLGSGYLPSGLKVSLTNGATLYCSDSAARITGGGSMNVASNCTLSNSWVMYQGSMSFQDGAKWPTSAFWLDSPGTNVLNFTLGSSGFTTLTPLGSLWVPAATAPLLISNLTCIADMANYRGGMGIITLVDFAGDAYGTVSNANFQTAKALSVTNADGYVANLQWNDSKEAIELNVTGAVHYWDNNGATAGFGTASGTWAASTTGNASQGWSRSITGDTLPVDVITATGSSVNFGYGANGLGAGTINVSGSVTNGNMTFASTSGDIVLSGGTIVCSAAETITVSNSNDTISSVLAGAATSLTKAGPGTLILAGTNTYVGATTVSNGALMVHGLTTNSAMTVVSGGTLGGTGKVGSVTVNVGGNITGNGTNTVGTLSVTNLSISENAVIYWNYDATAGTADLLNVTGALTLPTNVTVHVSGTGELPNAGLMFSSTLPIAGATDLINWTITGPGVNRTTFAVRVGNSVYLKTSSGTIITLQ